MKDHQIAQLVNELRQIAYDFHDHQSLRERISRAVTGAVRGEETASQMLSDEQIMACFPEGMGAVRLPSGWKAFARNVERAILAQQPAKSAAPAGEAIAEVAEDFIFFLRKQPNGERWSVGTLLYGQDSATQQPAKNERHTVEREALQHVVDCWEAAEVEGLQQALSDARDYSENTTAGRLADFLNRRISHGIERARAVLAATNDTGASNGN